MESIILIVLTFVMLPVGKTGTKRGKTVDFEKAVTFEKEGVPAWGGDFKELDFQDKIRSISFDGVDFLLPLEICCRSTWIQITKYYGEIRETKRTMH